MRLEIDVQQRINLRSLIAEIQANVPDAYGYRIVQPPQTVERDEGLVTLPMVIELLGPISEQDQDRVRSTVQAHAPEETDDEIRARKSSAQRLAQFEDIIEEAVRRARQLGGR